MGGSYENWYVGEVLDEFLHEAEILCTVVFGAYMNLQERDINFFHVIVVTFSRVADEQFTLWTIVLQPTFRAPPTKPHPMVPMLIIDLCLY